MFITSRTVNEKELSCPATKRVPKVYNTFPLGQYLSSLLVTARRLTIKGLNPQSLRMLHFNPQSLHVNPWSYVGV